MCRYIYNFYDFGLKLQIRNITESSKNVKVIDIVVWKGNEYKSSALLYRVQKSVWPLKSVYIQGVPKNMGILWRIRYRIHI